MITFKFKGRSDSLALSRDLAMAIVSTIREARLHGNVLPVPNDFYNLPLDEGMEIQCDQTGKVRLAWGEAVSEPLGSRDMAHVLVHSGLVAELGLSASHFLLFKDTLIVVYKNREPERWTMYSDLFSDGVVEIDMVQFAEDHGLSESRMEKLLS